MYKEIMYINGSNLTIDGIIEALSGKYEVRLEDQARKFCQMTRNQINQWLHGNPPVVYGINTGLGNMKDTVLSPEEHIEWNRTIPYPHAVGIGKPLNRDITRTALLIRANVLARGYSSVRPELIDRMLSIFNAGISPVIRELGSTGLSDLPPLAEMAMFTAGFEESEAFYQNQRINAREAFSIAGLDETFAFECKEVLASMNGSSMTQAISVLCYHQLESIFNQLSDNMLSKNPGLYQSICNTMSFMKFNLNKENNVSCDNPLLFNIGEERFEPVMGCNCSNTQIGYVMDLVPIIASDLAKYLYRNQFLNTNVKKGACVINLIDQLAIPATADSIATKAGQEDHVEFSYGAARKALQAVDLLQTILN
jgi:histidine ammonia-lyase